MAKAGVAHAVPQQGAAPRAIWRTLPVGRGNPSQAPESSQQ